jgi:hypothetical protein
MKLKLFTELEDSKNVQYQCVEPFNIYKNGPRQSLSRFED